MNIYKTFPVFIFLIFIFFSKCDTTEPPPDNRKLTLTFEDASCTEAWLQLTTENLQLPAEINLTVTDQDGNSVSHISILSTQDSLLYIDSLLPNKRYTIQAYQSELSSNKITVTTMDTTSHNFTWQTWTFGDVGSSVLYDVAIINENNIWAVGEINIADTSANGYTTYNAVHWDGNEWEPIRILYDGSIWQIRTIFALDENNIWFSAFVKYFNGQFIEMPIPNILIGWSINKIWGTSFGELYAVGNNGNIAYYKNGNWGKIESGTDIILVDIYGNNNSNEIFISGADNLNYKGIILKNEGTNSLVTLITSEIITENKLFSKLYGSLSSVWVDEKNNLYTGGNILFHFRHNKWDYVHSMPENYIGGNPNVNYRGFIAAIRGNNSNDYWVVGDRNTVRHFNGFSWEQIGLPYDPMSYVIWRSLDVKSNLNVIVGNNLNEATIMKIKK